MYQSKGLSEIVRNPSPLTVIYLNEWFTGAGAFGKALMMLGWPITSGSKPLLVIHDGELAVDLKEEAHVMYSKTIFSYSKQNNEYVLKVNKKRLLSPMCIIGTLQALWSQSKLLINYQKTFDNAKKIVENIPTQNSEGDDIKKVLAEKVWPNVIAVDYIGEFVFSAMTNKLPQSEQTQLIAKLQKRISPDDWYTKSILEWNNLKETKSNTKEFVNTYGLSADKEYELTEPRYYERLSQSIPNLTGTKIKQMDIKSLEDLYVGAQHLRSEAKKRSLFWIALLRKSIIY